MESLRDFYRKSITSQNTFENTFENTSFDDTSQNTHINHVVANGWGGYFIHEHKGDNQEEVNQDVSRVVFQHTPSFSYFPEHSNIDINLV